MIPEALPSPDIPLRVVAIIVTYFPKPEDLDALLTAIDRQVLHVVVVDNTPHRQSSELVNPGASVEWIYNGTNIGLPAAQNLGIERARNLKATHVVLFDQDSIPAPDMVQRLNDAQQTLIRRGVKLAAVGPRWLDRYTGQSAPFVRVGWTGLRHVHSAWADEGLIEADFLIASGSLIPISVLDHVGGMDESLFIDHVDIEWAFRAAASGFKMYGASDAVLLHGLGEAKRRVWLGKWWHVPVHSPSRNYYFARNTLLVDRRPYVSWRWRVSSCLRLAALATCFVTQVGPRMERLRAIVAGLRDGLHGRGGPAPI